MSEPFYPVYKRARSGVTFFMSQKQTRVQHKSAPPVGDSHMIFRLADNVKPFPTILQYARGRHPLGITNA